MLRRCPCGASTAEVECEDFRKKRPGKIRRVAAGAAPPNRIPPIVHEVLALPGRPLDPSTRAVAERRLGYDFSRVRVHADDRAARSARAVQALAYTVGSDVVFGEGRYAPNTTEGRRLLTHELVHVMQQDGSATGTAHEISSPDDPAERAAARISADGGPAGVPTTESFPPVVAREPTYPDASCDTVHDSINAAWPTARDWVRVARSRLGDPASVSGALQYHFKLDPTAAAQAADLAVVRRTFDRMAVLLEGDIDERCTPAGANDECRLPDGRRYAAYVTGHAVANGITHCLPSADVGFLSRDSLIETLVHEVAHLADPGNTDYAYLHSAAITTYEAMTRAQAIYNGDSYSEFARELYLGSRPVTPLQLTLSAGVLLGTGSPRWAIRAGYDIRSRSGIEVFDLVGGFHGFIALDPGATGAEPLVRDVGGSLDFGFISRSADTHFFADTRLGVFTALDVGEKDAPTRFGVSPSVVLGWADSGFRTGISLRPMFDLLHDRHAVIIGGEFTWGP